MDLASQPKHVPGDVLPVDGLVGICSFHSAVLLHEVMPGLLIPSNKCSPTCHRERVDASEQPAICYFSIRGH